MRVLITSGGTRERIDGVRVLTNISTGKLGAKIAEKFHYNFARVTYLHSSTAELPIAHSMGSAQGVLPPIEFVQRDSMQDVYNAMKLIVPNVDVVIHCMAVSDYTFHSNFNTKIKGNDIDSFRRVMCESVQYAPKILPMIKVWNSAAIVVGFKFMVGVDHNELFRNGRAQIKENHTDFCLANDKAEIKAYQAHIGHLISKCSDEQIIHCRNKLNIAHMIYRQVKQELY